MLVRSYQQFAILINKRSNVFILSGRVKFIMVSFAVQNNIVENKDG